MKKFTLFILAFMFISLNISAQQRIIVGNDYVKSNAVTLVAERGHSTAIKFDLNELNLVEVETGYGLAAKITSAKAPVMLDAGSPELIYLDASFIIPDVGSAELEITYGSYTDIENVEVAPSKGNLSRSVDPETVPYMKGDVYNQDAFFPGTLATLQEPFIMRDVRGQTLFVYPVQYNPVTKTLRIYSEITVNVVYNENEGINEFTTQKRHQVVDPAFYSMYNNMFVNYSSPSRGYPTGEEGELLIICHTAFADAMKPYIDWKRTIGRKTTMVPTSAISPLTAANIKTYITNYYNNPDNNLAYVLLVGDSPQIPAHGTTSVPSDIEYGLITGNDNYLEILPGRMSAENVAHVQTQVERSIWYERDITTTDTWLTTAVGLAHNEGNGGGHDGGESDPTHMNNIRNRLLSYGYSTVYQEYTGNASGVPNTTAAQISQRFNDGSGIANYCNHGSQTSWAFNAGMGLNYTNTHVNALQNAGKLPFIFSVACNNGEFTYYQVCFAETWMRATQGGQPTGAVATMMATISLSWLPPMTAQDEFIDLCLGITHTAGGFNYGITGNRMQTFAGAALNATQRMVQRHGSSSVSDYKSWTVFGDPTLQFRTRTPEEMDISHAPLIPIGASEFSVDCDAEGAVATISYIDDDGEVIILGTAVVADGVAEIIFDEPVTPVELTLAVTGFNKVTYINTDIQVGGELELPEPLNLTFEVELANHVILDWEAPGGKSLTIRGYNVYRDDEKINPELIREGVTFTDIAPQNGNYKYAVTASYGTTLESEFSEPITVMIDGMCIPVANIVSEEMSDTTVFITWEAPEYEGTELVGYNVYRNTVLIAEMLSDTILSFVDDTNLEYGSQYCYQIEVVYNDCEEPVLSEQACLTLAINDFGVQNFNIFPNPANGNVTIAGNGLTRVELYDVQGRKLVEYNNITDHLQISVNSFADGLYFVKLYAEEGTVAVKRLVVIKR